ncbi:MAG: ATP-dependent RecD-like DNA helicase [Streptococcaceae bacterium]|nr:ATP-dependent RecD-like DNA helicase [Streptococcaceae bacterium]
MTDGFQFSGEIVSIFFSNPSNFYKVVLLAIEDTDSSFTDSEIVVTGTIGDVIEGEDYTFYGQLTTHPKYGEQLLVTHYEKAKVTSRSGLVKFFSSDKFPGVGQSTAEKIVDAYPDDTVDAILEDPSALTGILSAAKRHSFLKRLTENAGDDRILSRLSKYNLPSAVNFRLIERYHGDALKMLQTAPYQLAQEVEGIGFTLADRIASQEGIDSTSPDRLQAGLFHVLKLSSMQTGDTYLLKMQLLQLTADMLSRARPADLPISSDALEDALSNLTSLEKAIEVPNKTADKVFEPSLYYAEERIVKCLTKKRDEKFLSALTKEKIADAIADSAFELNMTYDASQEEALAKSLAAPISLLTGGPGTGKTTIVQGLILAFSKLHHIELNFNNTKYKDEIFPIVLAAPTGRAARRLSETTGLPAATIHRHLGIQSDDENGDDFANELAGDLLIVDEFSMVDTWLAAKLLRAIPAGMQVVFVGDADQLPSVGPGQVFADLFRFPKMPQTRLTKVYRQSETSTILNLAESIKNGTLPPDLREKKNDRSFFAANAEQIPHLIRQIAESWKSRGNEPFELQILAPMYKGTAGIDNLNTTLQDVFNPKSEQLEFAYKNTLFREGDKVLHLINNAEDGVFNGDLGVIRELIPAKFSESKQDELRLNFDGIELTYPRGEWYKLTLAYAMSIHKAQGSEFQTVVLPLVSNFSRMLQRNLFYTAVTRAKQSLILLGELQAFEHATATVSGNRKTGLLDRLVPDYSGNEDIPQLTEEARAYQISVSADKVAESSVLEEMLLTEENWATIEPLIGLVAADFSIFNS